MTLACAGAVGLSGLAVQRALHAPPVQTQIAQREQVSLTLGEAQVTIAGPAGLLQVIAYDSTYFHMPDSNGVVHLDPSLELSTFPVPETQDFDMGRLQSIAVNGARLLAAFGPGRSLEEPTRALYWDPWRVVELPIPDKDAWLTGLHPRGSSFGGYLVTMGIEDIGSVGDRPGGALMAVLAGKVHPDVKEVTIDSGGIRVGQPVEVPGAEGQWVTRVLWVDGKPIFVLASGLLGDHLAFVDAGGKTLELPDDVFTASAMSPRHDKGTYLGPHGLLRPYGKTRAGYRFCVGAGGELTLLDETTEGNVVRTVSCDGATLSMRRDAQGRYRDVSVGDGPWRPLGSRTGLVSELVAEPLGPLWLVDSPGVIDGGGVLLFDSRGERVKPPSAVETLTYLAGFPSSTFRVAVVVSWLLPLVSLVLLVRGLLRARRFRRANGSLESRVSGLFRGQLLEGDRLKIGDAIVRLGEGFARTCAFTGHALGPGDVVTLVAAIEEPPPGGAPFRENEEVTLVPVRDGRDIGQLSALPRFVRRPFVQLILVLLLELPAPLVLLGRLGLGPYYP